MARQLSVIDDTKAPPPTPPAPSVPGERTIRIPVSGMTCAACQARVQRTLQRQPGVVDAGVNLMMHDATVRYSPDAVSPEQLVAAIRTVHEGEALLAPASTRRLIEQFAQPREEAVALRELTAREAGVLRLLARGLTNAEIAAELVVEPSTVKSHVASVLAKLDLRDRVQAVVFAYEHGVVRPGSA